MWNINEKCKVFNFTWIVVPFFQIEMKYAAHRRWDMEINLDVVRHEIGMQPFGNHDHTRIISICCNLCLAYTGDYIQDVHGKWQYYAGRNGISHFLLPTSIWMQIDYIIHFWSTNIRQATRKQFYAFRGFYVFCVQPAPRNPTMTD